MINKITKNLIIFGAIVFSFVFINTTFAYSCVGYSCGNDSYNAAGNQGYSQSLNQVNPQNGYYQYGSGSYNPNTQSNQTGTPVVNNYYMQNAPVTSATTKTATTSAPAQKVATSNTTATKNTTSSDTSSNNTNGTSSSNSNGNGLGASAYNGANGITALSLNGSGGFMPSSIWQWILVFLLILIIIVLSRMFVHKPSPADHVAHPAH